jgi:hypothetical protein
MFLLIKNNLFVNYLGPDHIGIMISPYKDIQLKRWSILNEKPLQGPLWNKRETYFVYYSCVKDCNEFNFSLELNVRIIDIILQYKYYNELIYLLILLDT